MKRSFTNKCTKVVATINIPNCFQIVKESESDGTQLTALKDDNDRKIFVYLHWMSINHNNKIQEVRRDMISENIKKQWLSETKCVLYLERGEVEKLAGRNPASIHPEIVYTRYIDRKAMYGNGTYGSRFIYKFYGNYETDEAYLTDPFMYLSIDIGPVRHNRNTPTGGAFFTVDEFEKIIDSAEITIKNKGIINLYRKENDHNGYRR